MIHNQNDYIMSMDVVFTWVWCIVSGVVAVIFTVFHLIRHLHIKRILGTCTVNIENGGKRERSENIKKEIDLRQKIRFVFSEYFSSPFTFGYFTPIIVLPAYMKEAGDEQWDFVVRHELNHIKLKHMAVKFFALITNFIHFFNPIVYLLRREICSMCEIDCDSKTIENYNTERRKKYEKYIVDTAIYSKGLYAMDTIGLHGDKLKKSKIQRSFLYNSSIGNSKKEG